MIKLAIPYIGVAALMMFALTANVSRVRFKHQAPYGYGPSDTPEIKELRSAARAHGNFMENAPFLLLILITMESAGLSAAALHAFGAVFLASRFIHAGVTLTGSLKGALFILRALAVLATWGLYLVGGLALVAHAF